MKKEKTRRPVEQELKPLTILHTADLHFDAPYTLADPRMAEERRAGLRAIWAEIAAYVTQNDIRLLLITGDLFDEANVARETVSFIMQQIGKIPDCRVFIAPGEHDPYHNRSPYKQLRWPSNVHIFRSNDLERVEIPQLNVDVYGYAFLGPAQTVCPLNGKRPVNKDRLNIAIGHGDTTMTDSRCCPITKTDIEFSGFDYIALGHHHDASGILQLGSTNFAYPGCIEGHGFDEPGPKGVIVGTIERGNCDLKGVRFSKTRYETLDFDVTDCADIAALKTALKNAAQKYGQDTALKVVLLGKTTLDIDTAQLEELLSDKAFTFVIDETVIGHDLVALRQDKTIRGVFFRKMEEKLLQSAQEDKINVLRAMRAGLTELMK